MLTLRQHAMVSGGLFVLILAMAWGGNALEASGIIKDPQRWQTPMQILFFSLFILFAFSLVPTMVRAFVAGQRAIGNGEKPLIGFFARHQLAIVCTIWGLWIAGFVVALPTMIRSGFFTDPGGSSKPGDQDDGIARQIARMPVQGTLVAAPGMTVEEMVRGSTLTIRQGANAALPEEPVYAGGAIFNYRVAGTAIEFPRCRYYFISTYTHDHSRIESINIGTASAKMSRAQLDAANADLRARLAADGWLTGHEVYRTEEDQQLHGGRTRGDEGRLWLKGDITLDIGQRRLDDPKADEDAGAGEWIQFVQLYRRRDYPSIERYVFAPPHQ